VNAPSVGKLDADVRDTDTKANHGGSRHRCPLACIASYVERGYGVFPCLGKRPRYPKGSHPRWAPDPDGPAGLHRAAWDVADVQANWPADPRVVPGLVPPLGAAFLDGDEKHRPGIVKWLLDNYPDFAENGVHYTLNGGVHIPGRVLDGVTLPQTVDPEVGIDTRIGLKGYVIAPPATGYRVVVPLQHVDELRPVPDSLLELLAAKVSGGAVMPAPTRLRASHGTVRLRRYVWSAVQGEHDRVAAAREGSRNQTLHTSAVKLGSLVGAGMLDEADAREALLSGVQAAENPLPDWEARRTIDSGVRYGITHPRQLDKASP